MFRRGKNTTGSRQHDATGAPTAGKRGRKTLLEPLEPRLLLSADPLLAALSDPLDDDAMRAVEPAALTDVLDHGNSQISADTETVMAGRSTDQGSDDWSDWDLPAEMEQPDRASLVSEVLASEPGLAPADHQDAASTTRTSVVADDGDLSPSEDNGITGDPGSPGPLSTGLNDSVTSLSRT